MIHHRDPAAIMITQFLPGELAGFQRAFVAHPTDALIYAVYSPSIPQFLDYAGPGSRGPPLVHRVRHLQRQHRHPLRPALPGPLRPSARPVPCGHRLRRGAPPRARLGHGRQPAELRGRRGPASPDSTSWRQRHIRLRPCLPVRPGLPRRHPGSFHRPGPPGTADSAWPAPDPRARAVRTSTVCPSALDIPGRVRRPAGHGRHHDRHETACCGSIPITTVLIATLHPISPVTCVAREGTATSSCATPLEALPAQSSARPAQANESHTTSVRSRNESDEPGT